MSAIETARGVVHVARDRELTFMAAAVAYYALASLVPLLLLALAVAALVSSEAALESFVRNQLSAVLSDSGQQVVADALTSVEGAAGAGIVSIALALWGGSKIFRSLDVAFANIYKVDHSPSFLEQLRDAVVVIGLLALAVAAMIATGVVVEFVPVPVGNPTLLGTGLLLVALIVGMLPIYYVLTPGDVDVGDVLPGAVLAAVGFLALQVVFLYYARVAGQYQTLGLLGALLLFVTWLYFGGIIVLLGGALNHVWDRPAA